MNSFIQQGSINDLSSPVSVHISSLTNIGNWILDPSRSGLDTIKNKNCTALL